MSREKRRTISMQPRLQKLQPEGCSDSLQRLCFLATIQQEQVICQACIFESHTLEQMGNIFDEIKFQTDRLPNSVKLSLHAIRFRVLITVEIAPVTSRFAVWLSGGKDSSSQ
jgi:hypothetical protein